MPAKRKHTTARVGKWNQALESLLVPLDALKVDPDNAKVHPERSVTAIADSLALFGQQKPVVVRETGEIVAGNGTLQAAIKLGWTHLAAVRFDQAGAMAAAGYALADNRSAEFAPWNDDQLQATLRELAAQDWPLERLGWNQQEMNTLLAAAGAQTTGGNGAAQAENASVQERWAVLIECADEAQQKELLARMNAEGYTVQALIV